MKIKQAYLKLFIRAAVSITLSLAFIVLLAKLLYTPPYYFTEFTCTQTQKTSQSCSFQCSFTPKSGFSDASQDLKLNLKAHFLLYNGMLDKTVNASLNHATIYSFELPRREYGYDFTVLAYDDKGRGGNVATTIKC